MDANLKFSKFSKISIFGPKKTLSSVISKSPKALEGVNLKSGPHLVPYFRIYGIQVYLTHA